MDTKSQPLEVWFHSVKSCMGVCIVVYHLPLYVQTYFIHTFIRLGMDIASHHDSLWDCHLDLGLRCSCAGWRGYFSVNALFPTLLSLDVVFEFWSDFLLRTFFILDLHFSQRIICRRFSGFVTDVSYGVWSRWLRWSNCKNIVLNDISFV